MVEQVSASRLPAEPRTLLTSDLVRSEMPALTSLRFFAAIAVVLFHFGWGAAREVGLPMPVLNMLSNGYLGVSFFFILSGFILANVYWDKLRSRTDIGGYGRARLARVYPVYLLALLMALPFQPPTSVMSGLFAPLLLHAWTLPASGLGQSWNAPGWTLSLELFFYLLLPVVLPVMRRLGWLSLAAVIGVLVAIILLGQTPRLVPGSDAGPILSWIPLPLLRFPEFMLGIGTAAALRRVGPLKTSKWSDAALCAVVLAVLLLAATGREAAALIAVCFAPLIALAAVGIGPVSRALANPVLLLLGGASYAVYLLQIPVNGIFDAAFGASWIARAVMPLGLLTLSVVVFLYLEEPARRWLRAARLPSLTRRHGSTSSQPQA